MTDKSVIITDESHYLKSLTKHHLTVLKRVDRFTRELPDCRKNRSTIDQIFIKQQILQKMWEYDVCIAFSGK